MRELQHRYIGVFDSGLGGISVLKELRRILPHENFLYFGDSRHAPYGEKNKEEIMQRCIAICEFFLSKGVKAIVIACNTATSACVKELRKRYADIIIIGMEPALKVAAEKDGRQTILVLATTFTLKEKKFANLMEQYELDNVIYKQPCPRLVEIVEGYHLADSMLVKNVLTTYLKPYDLHSLNSIVLGCTHFVFFKKYLEELLPAHINLIDGNLGTAKHLKHVLQEQGKRNVNGVEGNCKIYNSFHDDEDILQLSNDLLNA